MAYFGRRVTTAPAQRLAVGAITAQGANYGPFPVNARIFRIGGWTGRQQTAQTLTQRFALYRYFNGILDNTIAYTAAAVNGFNYQNASGGGNFELPVIWSRDASIATSLMVRQGEQFGIFPIADAANKLTIGAGSQATGASRNYYRFGSLASGATPGPTVPAYTGVIGANIMALYVEYTENRKPNLPAMSSPAIGSVIATLTPTFTLAFQDQDRIDGLGEWASAVTLNLYTQPTPGNYVLHGTQRIELAAPSEATRYATSAQAVTATWSGAALSYGSTYYVTARLEDAYNVQSDEYGRTGGVPVHAFTVTNAGYAASATPVGKLTTLTPANVTALYGHPSAKNATKAQARLYRRDAVGAYAVIATGTDVTLGAAVAPGGTISLTYAASGLPALNWATAYAIEWRITDADGLVGQWTGYTPFTTNIPPNAPANLTPIGGGAITNAPSLAFDMSDPDDTTPGLQGWIGLAGPQLVNGTFDTDAVGWTYPGNPAGVTATGARSTVLRRTGAGSYLFNITAHTGALNTYLFSRSDAIPCVAGATYTRLMWGNSSKTTLVPVIGFEFYNAAAALISTIWSSSTAVITGDWEQRSINALAPPLAVTMRVVIGVRAIAASPGAGTVYIDDIDQPQGLRYLLQATKDVTGNRWRYQTSAASHVNVSGVYSWYAYGYDGTLTGSASAPASFTMAVGPVVTLSSPTADQVFASNRPQFTWALGVGGTQNRYRATVFRRSDGAVAYQSAWFVNSVDRSFTVPAGFLLDQGLYSGQIEVEDNSALVGISARTDFSISYPAPDLIDNLLFTPEFLYLDDMDSPSAFRLTWDAVDTPPGEFVAIELWRQLKDQPATRVRVARWLTPDQVSYLDPMPPSSVDFTYLVRQIVRITGQERASGWTEVDARIDLVNAILCSVSDPLGRRVAVRYWPQRKMTGTQVQTWQQPAGQRDPTVIDSVHRGRDLSVTWDIIDNDQDLDVSADEYCAQFWSMFDGVGTGTADVYCWRDATGRREFMKFMGNPIQDDRPSGGAQRQISFVLRRVGYAESVAV